MVVWPRHGVDVGALAPSQLDLQLVQPMDEVAGEVDGADAEVGHRGMRLEAGEGGDDAAAGILRIDHAHHGGLAHDHRLRPRHGADQPLGQRMRAQAADLLVVGEGEMHRHLEPGALEGGDVGEAGGDEALHVAGAAAVELAVAFSVSVPGIGRPGLAVDRHDVGVARQHDAAFAVGADRGEEVGLGALCVGHQRAVDAEIGEVVADIVDQLEVGVARGGVERDQALQHVDGRRCGTHARHRRTVRGLRPRA